MPKMARNRSTLDNVLAQGASNRDITVYATDISTKFDFFFTIQRISFEMIIKMF